MALQSYLTIYKQTRMNKGTRYRMPLFITALSFQRCAYGTDYCHCFGLSALGIGRGFGIGIGL